ncbi:hypothetical protein H5410_051993 [Solanum commersonii]|uniref:Uncharacterized protein n=1 Tax=Solanum commersonii TaxID=4109 RepID=A0A9J5X2D0_SOLCO|nr:hypothetical protein H5410_051993 [Solanum commersonii]
MGVIDSDYKPLRNMIMRWWTTIQSFATRLRQNQANNDITTKKGLSTGATTTHTNQQPNQEHLSRPGCSFPNTALKASSLSRNFDDSEVQSVE